MFDIGFSELVIIAVVALIVIGPERLPRVARTAGHLFGRLQRYVNEVKADINREMELDELRRLRAQVQDAARSIEQSVSEASRDFESTMRGVERDLNASADGANASAGAAVTPAALPEAGEPPAPPAGTTVRGAAETPSEPPAGGMVQGTPPAAPEGGPVADTAPPRQASLPGFERG